MVDSSGFWYSQGGDPLAAYYPQTEQNYGLPSGALTGIVAAENTAPGITSSAGARTQFQIIPSTAQQLGVNLNDDTSAMHGAAKYYKQQLDAFGDPGLAYAAYNAGPGTVQMALRTKSGFSPQVTQYVKTALAQSGQKSDYFNTQAQTPESKGAPGSQTTSGEAQPIGIPVPVTPPPQAPEPSLMPARGSQDEAIAGDRTYRDIQMALRFMRGGSFGLSDIMDILRGGKNA